VKLTAHCRDSVLRVREALTKIGYKAPKDDEDIHNVLDSDDFISDVLRVMLTIDKPTMKEAAIISSNYGYIGMSVKVVTPSETDITKLETITGIILGASEVGFEIYRPDKNEINVFVLEHVTRFSIPITKENLEISKKAIQIREIAGIHHEKKGDGQAV